jgi:hypothetical protein
LQQPGDHRLVEGNEGGKPPGGKGCSSRIGESEPINQRDHCIGRIKPLVRHPLIGGEQFDRHTPVVHGDRYEVA